MKSSSPHPVPFEGLPILSASTQNNTKIAQSITFTAKQIITHKQQHVTVSSNRSNHNPFSPVRTQFKL
jgi:hypothetical protein